MRNTSGREAEIDISLEQRRGESANDGPSAGVTARRRAEVATLVLGIGLATAAAHIGNNFTTYLIGGLIDRYGFSPMQMGAWSMLELLAYAVAMFGVAPRVGRLSPRSLLLAAGALVVAAQLFSAAIASFAALLLGRVAAGFGFGLANTALNLAAGRTEHPARAISTGIAVQTCLYAIINVALPMVGVRFGVEGMFCALALLSGMFTLSAAWLPGRSAAVRSSASAAAVGPGRRPIGSDGWTVLAAMALFTFGSLAIWPFMERAAHAIGISAVIFGRYQSAATVMSALGNLTLAAVASRMRRTLPLMWALAVCACACGALTTVREVSLFGMALIVFNVSWFVSYPLLLGIAYAVDGSGRLAVLSSAVWLLMMALGSLASGITAQFFGGYGPVGPTGMLVCGSAALVIWPLAGRLDALRCNVMPN